MKRTMFLIAMGVVVIGLSGCCKDKACCQKASPYPQQQQQAASQASPAAAVAYPYYTVRGPRDFLDRNPESIGP
jgi:hypothetical protein